MADIVLNVEVRDRTGTGGAREARRQGQVPGVLYGGPKGPVSVAVRGNEFRKALYTGKLLGHLVTLQHGGEKQQVIAKDVQFHPVTSRPIHVDFLRIGEHAQVNVNVPVNFVDEEESPGLKRGGVLNVVRHDLELICDAARIPDQITISLAGLDIGDAIHISQVSLPEGSKSAIDDRDFTVATVVAPSAMKAEADEAAAAAEAAADEVPTLEEGEEAEGEGAAEGESESGDKE